MHHDALPADLIAGSVQPANLGELEGADAVGTVGNASCGELMRLWVKFKDQDGRRVIDRATFQSFGCETAIAVASVATELIRGKTPEEALNLRAEQLAGELGPLPPLKIHCAELVEGALRSALEPSAAPPSAGSVGSSGPAGGSLLDRFLPGEGARAARARLVYLENDPPEAGPEVR
ncbi:MAG: FeS assembly protein [Verrucomicrobia bacterium]|nr:FeS assembly protein [Verrucomicrobiota bacterium]